MKFIGDLEDIDLLEAQKMSEKGVDVFNINDSFFNDICHPFTSENGDIIIKDRRIDLFQNVTFCGEGCLYNGIDYTYIIAKCVCDADIIQIGEDNNLGLNNERKGISLNDIINSFKGHLFNFNFKVITCYNLVINASILKRNLGFQIMISLIGIELFLFLYFSKDRLKPIKNYMLIFEPFDPNIDPPNPPKKKKILEILNSENDKLSNLVIENKNNYEKDKSLNNKQKEIITQKSQKSILFNNLIIKKNQSQKTCNNNFNKFLTKSKFYKSKTIHNNENDDALVVQYSNENENESNDNSYIFNLDYNINDSSDINKTESNIEDEYEKEGKEDKKKFGITIHKKNKENNNNKITRFEKNNYDVLEDIDYKNKTLILGDKKSKKNQINLLENKLNKNINLNNPKKYNSNIIIPRVYPKKNKISFNEPIRVRSNNIIKIQNSDKSMIQTAYNNNNKKLNISKNNSLDNENEINIERNEDENRGKYIETITQVGEDIKIHNKRKMNKKTLKSILKSRNISQMLSTDILVSNNEQKLKNIIKNKKDKNMNSNKEINRRKRSNNTMNCYLNRRKQEDGNENENKNNIGNMKLRNKKVNMAYTDEEFKEMPFEEALHNDKRSFIRMYWSYLKEEHIIINNIFLGSYLDLRIIKLSFLFFSVMINFFLNSFFYTDDYISGAYHNYGVLDFVSSLPKAIYSFFVTIIILNLLKMLSNNKKNLQEIIKENLNKMKYLKRMESALKQLKIKLIIYFIFLLFLGLFFLYYITAFCAVYQNSQKYWIYGCLESLFLDMISPFIGCIFLACFRYFGLIKHSNFFYSLASFLSNIL